MARVCHRKIEEQEVPFHCFEDVHSFLTKEARDALDRVPLSGKYGEALCNEMAQLELAGTLFAAKAPGIGHDQDCDACSWPVLPEEMRERMPLKVVLAGTTYIAWSNMGLRMKEEHHSLLTFMIWIFLIRKIQPRVVVHECVTPFEPELLTKFLGGSWEVFSTVYNPTDCGWPINRHRRYSLAVNTRTAQWASAKSFQDVHSIFDTSLELTGDVFFMADNADIEAELREILQRRRINQDSAPLLVLEGQDWRQLYSVGTQERLYVYEAHKEELQSVDGLLFADATQNLRNITRQSGVLPCLLTHPVIYSFQKKRHLVPRELLAAQGFATTPRTLLTGWTVPWASAIDDGHLTPGMIRKMAGNGMHMQVVTLILLHVLGSVEMLTSASEADSLLARTRASLPRLPTIRFDDDDDGGLADGTQSVG